MWGLALGNVFVLGVTLVVATAAIVYLTLNHDEPNRNNVNHQNARVEKRRRKRIRSSETDQLCRDFKLGHAKCSVCIEDMKPSVHVWNCSNCYTTYHLFCIKIWANSSSCQRWKCPTCRHEYDVSQNSSILTYKCFCGRIDNPQRNAHVIPHSCGHICIRDGCSRICHPGQCPNEY